MGRPRDDYHWDQVTIEDGKLKCKRCSKRFKGGVSRIKEHLGTKKRTGNIGLCPRRDDELVANGGVNNPMLAGSSNQLEAPNEFELVANGGVNNGVLAGSSNQVEAPNEFGLNNSVLVASSNQLEASYRLDSLPEIGPEFSLPSYVCYNEEAEGHHNMISAYSDGPIYQNDAAGPSNMVEGLPRSNEAVGISNSGLETRIKKIREDFYEFSRWEELHKEERQWLEYCGKKYKNNDWPEKVEALKEKAFQIIDLLHQDALQDPQKEIDDLESKLTELKSERPCYSDSSCDQYFEEMRDLLRDDNVFFIGVCGMGGMGKTWLVTHFRNQIRWKKSFNFENVYWVTVSQDFSILKLQNSIAKRIGEKLDDEDEITDRAEILSCALGKIDRSVLILDDVWNYIDLQKVGIPLRTNGIKLILTSRLKHVFQQMDCPEDNLIRMEWFIDDKLGHEEERANNWELFFLKLGCNGRPATLPGEVERIAKSIVDLCDGLPLGVIVMAKVMKGVYDDDVDIWRHTMNKLKNSAMGEDMEEEVIKVLKRSYDHLGNNTIQDCFLLRALYSHVSKEVFVMNLVDEGLIQTTGSLEKVLVEGREILAKLKSHSMLYYCESIYEFGSHMHGLLRDMANDIVKGRFMLRCNKGLHNIPEMQEWAPHLEKVSLMENFIKEIPEGTSPECPQLSTLNFRKNMIRYIPDCFFYRLEALTLLDLSYNEELTSLPNSLSSLRCLKSLLLEGCRSLQSVPPLENLQELSRLVISWTSIKEVPHGLGKLAKLRWLDLSDNRELVCVEWSVIFGLTNVQYLNLRETSITGEVEIVHGMMSRLEYFVGSFQVAKHLSDFVENILNRDGGLKYYEIGFRYYWGMFWERNFTGRKRKLITVENFEGFEFLLPSDLDRLGIRNNKQWSGDLCGAFSFKAPSSLREIEVSDCPKLERLCCMSGRCSFCQHLQNLQSLDLYKLERLDFIWSEEDEFIGLPNLSKLRILNCDRIETLMRAAALAKFPKLESIKVTGCKSMKEVFATGMSEDDPDLTITLPNSFKRLYLSNLPELVSVCGSIIVSESPPEVRSYYCRQLRQSHLRHKRSPSASESNIKIRSL